MDKDFQISEFKHIRKQHKQIIGFLILLVIVIGYYFLKGCSWREMIVDLKNSIVPKIPVAVFTLLIFKIFYKWLNGNIADSVQQDIVDALKGNCHLVNCLSDKSRQEIIGNVLKTRLGSEDEDNERGALASNIRKYILGEYNIRKNFIYRIMIYDSYPKRKNHCVSSQYEEEINKIISAHKGVWMLEQISYEKEYGNGQSFSMPLSIAFLADSEAVFSDILSSQHAGTGKKNKSAQDEYHLFREFFMIDNAAWEILSKEKKLCREFVKNVMYLNVKINDNVLNLDIAEYDIKCVDDKYNLVIQFRDDFIKKLNGKKNIKISIETVFPVLYNRLFAAELCELSYLPEFSAQWQNSVKVSAYPHWSDNKNDVTIHDNGIILTSRGSMRWFFPPSGLILAIHGNAEDNDKADAGD